MCRPEVFGAALGFTEFLPFTSRDEFRMAMYAFFFGLGGHRLGAFLMQQNASKMRLRALAYPL
jgi:hypothetical protein